MNFDLIYGVATFIFNIVTFIAVILLINDYKDKNTIAQATRMFLDARRFTLAFVFLLIAALSLAVGYSISAFIAVNNPQTTFWEYTNILVFLFLMLFFVLFSGFYTSRRVKRKLLKPTSVEVPTNNLNQNPPAQSGDSSIPGQPASPGDEQVHQKQ
ncbi:MAG: hypothetical protein OH316_00120 [Candidatus Parvarchaeota archaeon]|nr:hypothetical protein [Candidatus Parvarchaeota archaeon]MCW1301534.1 hypothetical protein [Candidatus Parvarchaeota archaeon]